MAVSVTINQSAIDELLGADGPIAARLYNRALRVQSRAKQLCPVDTGRLRASIQVTPPYKRRGKLTTDVGTNVEYAIFVHNGTRYMAARPFLRNALIRET